MKDSLDSFLSFEEDFHGSDRKLSRKERKQASQKDRSKYKKTDQDQRIKRTSLPQEPLHGTLQGHVLGIYPEEIQVQADQTLYQCQLKGALKKEKNNTKNLIAVGDIVLFEPREETKGQIVRILPRKTVLSRADNLLRHKEQLIAVNIDQVIITASVVSPPLKPFLIDRYIIAAQKGKMDCIIVVNKIDLLENPEDKEFLALCQEAYQSINIPFLPVSTQTGEGISSLKKLMEHKTSVFSGQSGTGKSSLINATCNMQLKTGSVVEKTSKGAHTTTITHLCPLENGGFCIDTPGIKSFGVWDLQAQDVEQFFTEIAQEATRCRFQGCLHDQEPDCAVKASIENGSISPLRLASYHALIATLKEKHRNR